MRSKPKEALRKWSAESAVSSARFEIEYQKLRNRLIEEEGLEWVERIEGELNER